jgi:opacity protein-like surface antigen
MTGIRGPVVAAMLIVASVVPAMAADPVSSFREGTTVWSIEAGAGSQDNIGIDTGETGLDLWLAGLRVGRLVTDSWGSGLLRGAVELGLEALYQRYTHPVRASFQGLAAVGRFHGLGLGLGRGRVVPYLEGLAAAGATDLEVREIDSEFTFWLAAGAGLSVFVTDSTAVYVGYRLVHVSNGNTDSPNRGVEAHTGMLGVSFFLQ